MTVSAWIEMVPGVRRRTLVSSDQMMQMEVLLDQGSHVPEHQHPNEQITYVVRGCLRMTIDGTVIELAAGQSVLLLSNALHSVDVTEDSLVIDTFCPPREDLLEQDRALLSPRSEEAAE